VKKAKFWIERSGMGYLKVHFTEPKEFSFCDWGWPRDTWCFEASRPFLKKLGIEELCQGELLEIEVKAGTIYVWE